MSKYQVGDDLVIDPSHRTVQQNGVEIKLPELSYRLLLILVENAPCIVSHDKLVEAVWQERVVSDENLKKRVSRLRHALSDEADSPRYIVAERGMGYRCIAPVIFLADSIVKENVIPQPTKPRTSTKRLFKPALIVSLFIIAGLGLMVTIVPPEQKAPSTEKIGDFTAQDYVNKATNYYYRFKPDDNDTVVKLYKKAIELDPNFGPAYGGLANAYAQGYYQFGKDEDWLQQSIIFSMRAIEIEPEQPWGYKSLGLAFHLSGRYDESLIAYSKASTLAPTWAGPVANSALVYLEKGHLIPAYQYLMKSVKMDLKDPIAYSFLGFCYRELRMTEHAKKALDKTLALKPD
jgi:DNA-binding winged helix-turn-helix (wHTH) protein